MKKFIYLLFLCFFVFTSCEKDTIENEQILEFNSKANNINADLTVAPSGDASGVTDVITIENALAALSPGDVLLLGSGTFYINRTIVAPVGFNGTLRGVNMYETQINPVGDNGVPYGLSLINFSGETFPILSSSLLFFPDPSGILNVSNFSSTLPDAFATDINFFGNQNFTSFITINFENNEADTNVSNLRLVGTEAHPSSSFLVNQPDFGVQLFGNGFGFPNVVTGGTHTLSECNISKVGIQAAVYQLLKEAQIIVSDNSFSDIRQLLYRFLDGCTVDISKNEMTTESFGALVVTQEGVPIPGASNTVRIYKNEISTAGFMPIEIGFVPAGAANFDLLIDKNKLTVGPDPLGILPNLSGIAIFNGNEGAIVRNNQILGEAQFGILTESNSGTFFGNNLQRLDASEASYGIFGDNNTLIGIGNSTVLDLGINNIITGMQMVAGESIGERLKAAQAKRKEILEAYNNY